MKYKLIVERGGRPFDTNNDPIGTIEEGSSDLLFNTEDKVKHAADKARLYYKEFNRSEAKKAIKEGTIPEFIKIGYKKVEM